MAPANQEFCHGAQEFLPDTPKLSPDVRKSLPDARELRSDASEFCPSTPKMSLAIGSFIGVPRSLARGHPRSVPVHGTFARTSPSSTRAPPRLIRGGRRWSRRGRRDWGGGGPHVRDGVVSLGFCAHRIEGTSRFTWAGLGASFPGPSRNGPRSRRRRTHDVPSSPRATTPPRSPLARPSRAM